MAEEGKGLRLKGRVALVTGGAQGIGRAFSLGLADEGAKLVIADINAQAADVTAKDIHAKGGEALALKTDVSSVESTLDMGKKAVERFGRIDILVNNAAVMFRIPITRVPFYELDVNEWDRVMAVNLKGPFLCSRAVFPYMKAQGGGKIINLSSTSFFFGQAEYVHYVSSKGGIIGLTRSMAREVGDYGIRVNAIAPGAVLSEDPSDKAGLEARMARLDRDLIPKRSLKFHEYPKQLLGALIFLASSDSDFITGQTIVVDGGDVMH
jgi:3-oxoacyl-[acyl-carrier protein] reductase